MTRQFARSCAKYVAWSLTSIGINNVQLDQGQNDKVVGNLTINEGTNPKPLNFNHGRQSVACVRTRRP
jgi:hypothetical protein